MSSILFIVLALCGLTFGAVRPVPRLDGRIVGGENATIEKYPYQLSLYKHSYGGHWCGASIIGPNHALTAAHCVRNTKPSEFSMHAGTSYKTDPGSTHIVTNITINPKYKGFDYDYAIVEVDTPFPIGQAGIQSIELCSVEPSGGEPAVVTGWGALSLGGGSPNQLQVVNVQVYSREDCRNKYSASSITERMICAGVKEGGKDACNGDSGGPLVVNGKVCGVVSWSIGCGEAKHPHVYASVAAQLDWIKATARL